MPSPADNAATVREGAHFYMAHRMREFPHPDVPDITMGEHTPGPDCPGCAAEAALDALLAQAEAAWTLRERWDKETDRAIAAEAERDAAVRAAEQAQEALRQIAEMSVFQAHASGIEMQRVALAALAGEGTE